jgi:hypothetical protein
MTRTMFKPISVDPELTKLLQNLPKAKPTFDIEPYCPADKSFFIRGPEGPDGQDGIRLEVDHDDVDHKFVRQQANEIVKLLNLHWGGKRYSR